MPRSIALLTLSRTKVALFVVPCLALSALAAGVRAHLTPVHAAASEPLAQVSASAQAGTRARHVETELVTVTPRGFEPQEITRPAGEFILMIENRSGQVADLRFAHATAERLHEVRASREEPDWSEVMNLHPGSYVLTEVGHPEWACRVTITPR